MTRTGECACEQGWDQIQTNLQEWSWAGEQALSSRQLNNRGFPLIFLNKEIFPGLILPGRIHVILVNDELGF